MLWHAFRQSFGERLKNEGSKRIDCDQGKRQWQSKDVWGRGKGKVRDAKAVELFSPAPIFDRRGSRFGRVSLKWTSIGFPLGGASVSRAEGVHLTGVHLIGVYLMGVYHRRVL